MAKITCTEHNRIASDPNGKPVLIFDAPLVEQALAAPGAGSQQTAAVTSPDCRFLRICSDVALHISANANATVNSDYYPAGSEIVVPCAPNQRYAYLAG